MSTPRGIGGSLCGQSLSGIHKRWDLQSRKQYEQALAHMDHILSDDCDFDVVAKEELTDISEIPAPMDDEQSLLKQPEEEKDVVLEGYFARLRTAYCASCRALNLVPSGYIQRMLGRSNMTLVNHHLGPRGAKAFAVPLAMSETLVSLNLSNTGVEDEGVKSVTEALTEYSTVEHLLLSGNSISCHGLGHIAKLLLLPKTKIRRLDISGNRFGERGVEHIEDIIKNCHFLENLDISNNDLDSMAGVILGKAIGENDTLVELNLGWNHIRLKGALSIAKGIQENERLERLVLAWNGLGVEGARAIGKALVENTTLKYLDLSCTRLTEGGAALLATGLERNQGLSSLILAKNTLSKIGAYAIVQAVTKNPDSTLTHLDLSGAMLNKEGDDLVKALRESSPELTISYDTIPQQKPYEYSLDTLTRYFVDKMISPMEHFNIVHPQEPIAGEGSPIFVDRSAFSLTLQDPEIGLTREQRQYILDFLGRRQSNTVDISPIVRKYDKAPKAED